MYYVYVIKSKKDFKCYKGLTNDLRKRFKEHNDNKVISTKGRCPFELIYPVRKLRHLWQDKINKDLIPYRKSGGKSPVFSNGVYYEECINRQDAKTREKYLKSGMGKRYIKNRLKRFLFLTE